MPTATNTNNVGPSGSRFIPYYWDTVLGENLYPNLYFYQFGTKRSVPRNFGTSIKIPRLKKQNIVYAQSEGSTVYTCSLCAQYISGSMSQFAGAYKHTDLVIMTALSDVVELSLIDIARDIARRMDRTIRNALSGVGGFISHAGVSDPMAVLRGKDIIEAVVKLDAYNNPRPPDNHYPTIIHPYQTYDIMTNTSAGNWLDVIKYTDGNVNRAYIGEIGRLYGARFVTSSNIRNKFISASGATQVSGAQAYMFAPDAYYVTEISDMTAKTYVKGLGSAGAGDPVNQYATVGAKVFFGVVPNNYAAAIAGETEHKTIRILSKFGLSGAVGDRTV